VTGSSPVGGSRRLVEGIKMKTAVFTSFDENYAEYALVMVKTFCENYHGEPIDLYCLTPESIHSLEETYRNMCGNPKNVNIIFATSKGQKEIDQKITNEDIEISYITTQCFHRIFIADEFPEIDIAIYIDPDTIILRDVQPLIDYPLASPIVAKAEAANPDKESVIGPDKVYFNNGVYKTDLGFWRENKISDRMMSHIASNGISTYPEQDLMNIFLWDHVSELPINFNMFAWLRTEGFFRATVPNPLIVHFVGPAKPWKKHDVEKEWNDAWRNKYKEIYGLDISTSKDFLNPYEYEIG
jgi:lipopolysaccharide biosynthesis glycosyltransferase